MTIKVPEELFITLPHMEFMEDLIKIQINENTITITGAYNVSLKVNSQFRYLGNQTIRLKQATAHQYMFVVSSENNSKKTIEKQFFLQYEYFDRDKEGSYNYQSQDIIHIGGRRWIRDNFLFISDPKYHDPNSDTNQMNIFYMQKGYEVIKYIANNRLVTYLDDERRSELLVIYSETVDENLFWSMVENDEIIQEKWVPMKEAIKQRALSSFEINTTTS